MLKFGDAHNLQLIWVALALFFTGMYLERLVVKRLIKYFGKKNTTYLSESVSLAKKRMHWFLQALALFFFAIALARPLIAC
jgi:Ca-activated chloride channel family protein